MKKWQWLLISGVLEGLSGACVIMAYRAKAIKQQADTWDKALAEESARSTASAQD